MDNILIAPTHTSRVSNDFIVDLIVCWRFFFFSYRINMSLLQSSIMVFSNSPFFNLKYTMYYKYRRLRNILLYLILIYLYLYLYIKTQAFRYLFGRGNLENYWIDFQTIFSIDSLFYYGGYRLICCSFCSHLIYVKMKRNIIIIVIIKNYPCLEHLYQSFILI